MVFPRPNAQAQRRRSRPLERNVGPKLRMLLLWRLMKPKPDSFGIFAITETPKSRLLRADVFGSTAKLLNKRNSRFNV